MAKTADEYIGDLNKIDKVLGGLDQSEIGWLYSATRRAPTYQNSELNENIQGRLDHAVSGLSIVYMFALFETYFPKSKWKKHIAPDVLNKLLAYRHIRHSIAHGFDGDRARDHRDEFEVLMNTSEPDCIKDWDENKLLLNEYGYKDLMLVMKKAIISAKHSFHNSQHYV